VECCAEKIDSHYPINLRFGEAVLHLIFGRAVRATRMWALKEGHG
jgi:hypothetical protein